VVVRVGGGGVLVGFWDPSSPALLLLLLLLQSHQLGLEVVEGDLLFPLLPAGPPLAWLRSDHPPQLAVAVVAEILMCPCLQPAPARPEALLA
jgi:hypothetical protein